MNAETKGLGFIMQTRDVPSAARIDEQLRAEHQELESRFLHVLGKLRGADRDEVRRAWLAMESQLRGHMRAEERHLLPRFAEAHPAESQRICEEHAQIRAQLDKFGIDLDLHALSVQAAEQFIGALRQHAAREDALYYVWAESHASELERSAIHARRRERVRLRR